MRRLHRPVYERRVEVLGDLILPLLNPGDRVLDVGCGGGGLGRHLLARPALPQDITWSGLERAPRGNEPFHVTAYDGDTIPFDTNSFDVVVLADVLHHEENENRLIAECIRVSRQLLIIKDHQRSGLLAQQREI